MANPRRPRRAARETNPKGSTRLGESPERGANAHHQETLLDEAIEETFPASDPISPMLVT